MKIKFSLGRIRGIVCGTSFLAVILAFVIGGMLGCTTYTNGDAQVDNQSMGAAQDIQKQATSLKDPNVSPDAASKTLDTILADAQDIVANSKQQIDVHGGAASFTGLTAYSASASLSARNQSTQDHSTPWYLKILYGIIGVATGAGGMAAAAAGIPFIGNFLNSTAGKALDAVLAHVGDIHGKAQAGTLTATDVVSGVGDLLSDPSIKPIEGMVLDALHIGGHTTPTAAAASASVDAPPPPPPVSAPTVTAPVVADAPAPAAPAAVPVVAQPASKPS